MLWQEDDPQPTTDRLNEVVDLLFRIDCRELPVDHMYALSEALVETFPALTDDARFGVHEVHLAGAQNGWERPDPELGQNLILSKRTRLIIRVPENAASETQNALEGKTLDISGYTLTIGKAKHRKISTLRTIFARHIALEPGEDENEELLLNRVVTELESRNIKVSKALCGVTQTINTPEGPLHTRSIMFADLSPEASIQLQCEGLGSHRHMGCGIFLPHKGIEAVNKQQKD